MLDIMLSKAFLVAHFFVAVACDGTPNNRVTITVTDDTDGPIVNTPQGTILGKHQISYDGRKYSSFEGIPYAKPPVGSLRFEEPQPADQWDNVLVANKSYMCSSYIPLPILQGVHGTEDCLYMYVYVSREKINPEENLPVVVHIHGGAFMLGSPKFLAGPVYIMDKNVVYVSFNYRLGVLGFLSTEDDVVPGNNGLKDQSLALKWIKDNVKYFGGNPDSITITGLSAGAASVHYHYLSPLSKGLFHRGFSQSGTALQCWALNPNPLQNAEIVALNLTCPTNSTKQMIRCLKEKPVKEVVLAVKNTFVYFNGIPFAPFTPVIENGGTNAFISEHPYELLKRGEINDVPWVSSNTIQEGIFPTGFFVMINKLKEVNDNWNDIMWYALDLQNTMYREDKRFIMQKIRKFYLKNEELTMENVYNLVDLFTDRLFMIDTEKAIRLHAQVSKSPVYYYQFGYVLQLPSFFASMKKGVAHSDDGRLLFQIIGTPAKLPEGDEKMMRAFTNFIEKFANTGIPSFENKEWLTVSPNAEAIDYLYIGGPENITMKQTKALGPKDFWKSLPIHENENHSFASSEAVKIRVISLCMLILIVLNGHFVFNKIGLS